MSTQLDAIQRYAEAKSHADVDGALAACTEDVVLETLPFQLTATGREDTRRQLEAFFSIFPDYAVSLEGLHDMGDTAVGWGRVRATMAGALVGIEPTGKSFEVPFACVWTVRSGLIGRERFYFDLNHVCEQLGLSTDAVAAELRRARELLAQPS